MISHRIRQSLLSVGRRLLPRTGFSGNSGETASNSDFGSRNWPTIAIALLAGIGVAFQASGINLSASGDKKPHGAVDLAIEGPKYPSEVPAVIEVAKNSRMKYEWDKENNLLRLDRVLSSAVFYPHDYGFIPQTLCGDGDPLDVLVLGDTPLQPGCVCDIRPIGYMVMEDEKGTDEKVLAVIANDPHYKEFRTLRDVPEHTLREISHFFETYKSLEKEKWVKVGGWRGSEDTKILIEKTHKTFTDASSK